MRGTETLAYCGTLINYGRKKFYNIGAWVELPEHGSDAPAGNGLVASGAEGPAKGVKVGLAVRPPFVLEEVAVGEGLTAGHAHEAA